MGEKGEIAAHGVSTGKNVVAEIWDPNSIPP